MIENRETTKRLRDAAAGLGVSGVLEVGLGEDWLSVMVPGKDG